jgi:hypothetical protein
MHRPWQRRALVSLAVLGVALWMAAHRFRRHDQDVTIYSATPDSRVQVIGLRHRTYLFDYGGATSLVLSSTTFSTGVVTYGRQKDVFPADPDEVR